MANSTQAQFLPLHATQSSSVPLPSSTTMAQTSSSPPPLPPDMIDLNLTRLLFRLDKKIPQISPTDRQSKPAPGALPGVVERRKIAAVCALVTLFTQFTSERSPRRRLTHPCFTIRVESRLCPPATATFRDRVCHGQEQRGEEESGGGFGEEKSDD